MDELAWDDPELVRRYNEVVTAALTSPDCLHTVCELLKVEIRKNIILARGGATDTTPAASPHDTAAPGRPRP